MRLSKFVVAVVGSALLLSGVALAQQAQPGAGGRRQFQQPGGPGQFDPAQFQQRMLERMRETLGASDDEWAAIRPLLQDVMEKQRNVRMRGPMMFGPRPGGAQGGPEGPQPVANLRSVLENQNASAQQIRQALDAYRKWRQQQEEELKKAQDKLRSVLTVRQEAQLVLMGILD